MCHVSLCLSNLSDRGSKLALDHSVLKAVEVASGAVVIVVKIFIFLRSTRRL